MIELKYDAEGLVPVVAQDAATGQVLMVAYMNREALGKTLQTGEAWYWSRSRRALWRKGEESGHAQTVRRVRVDCDADALLLTVDQHGAACHTGHRSCFFRTLEGSDAAADGERVATDILDELFELLKRRRAEMPARSYTTSLLRAGRTAIADKVREEAEELLFAAGPGAAHTLDDRDAVQHRVAEAVGLAVALVDQRRLCQLHAGRRAAGPDPGRLRPRVVRPPPGPEDPLRPRQPPASKPEHSAALRPGAAVRQHTRGLVRYQLRRRRRARSSAPAPTSCPAAHLNSTRTGSPQSR